MLPEEEATRAAAVTLAEPTRPTAGQAAPVELHRLRTRRELRVALLVAGDLAALFLSGTAAYLLWALPVREQGAALYLGLTPLLLLFAAGYAQAGLYPGFGIGPVEMLRRLTYVTSFVFLILATFSFVLKAPHLYSRVTFGIALLVSLLAVPLTRIASYRLAQRWDWWLEPVLLAGGSEELRSLAAALGAAAPLGYRPVAALVTSGDPAVVRALPTLPGLDASADLAGAGVRVVLVTGELPAAAIDALRLHFRHVVVLRSFGNLPVEGVRIRNFGHSVGIEYTNELLRGHNRLVKRTLDLAVGGLGLLVAVPVIAVAALTVKLLSRGPAFFVQPRTGLGGRRIAVPKIRTMHADAERRLERHLAADPALRAEWEERMKLRHDPRLVPVVGRFLRRFSLDELPQLWSVVKGDMSLVGPRPFPDYHLDQFSPRFRELRQRVRPGITGLWQVSSRSDGGIGEQEAADSHYIRNWSLWLDLYVLARTLGAVISGKGAY